VSATELPARTSAVAPDEPALAERLATAARLLHREGHLNYSGHVSARVAGGLLIHTYDSDRSAVQAADLLRCDLDGQPIGPSHEAHGPSHASIGPSQVGIGPSHAGIGPSHGEVARHAGRPPLEVFIHAEIYRARPDVHAILHTHSELAVLFTLAETCLRPMKASAVRWASGIPIHADPTLIRTPRQGRELAQTLGPHHAALLRAHGGVIVAESVEAMLVDAIHFDENARAQLEASRLGAPLKPLTPDELRMLEAATERDRHVAKLWSYYLARENTP
jgi:ribulose-5-phosphate 4-epimerase/fuculose-1-phosphate aldolase